MKGRTKLTTPTQSPSGL